MTSCCTLCHRLCLKKWIRSQDKIDFKFENDSNVGVHPPYNPDFILPPCPFWLLNKTEGAAGRTDFYQGSRTSQKAARHFRAQRYIYLLRCINMFFGYAEAARNECGQWRDVPQRPAEICWRYAHWFPFYITCDGNVGLALVLPIVHICLGLHRRDTHASPCIMSLKTTRATSALCFVQLPKYLLVTN